MIPITPPANIPEKPITPYVKPIGNFNDPKYFKTEAEAIAYTKLKGGLVQKDALKGGFTVLFSRRSK